MFEALKKIFAAAEELGPVQDVSIIGAEGKLIIIEGSTADDLNYTMQVSLKRPGQDQEGE